MTFTCGSLFTGIGGIDLAFVAAGCDILFQVEIDPYCTKVLEKHHDRYWPNATRFTDVREVGGHNLPAVDILFGGFPCQDISVAGKGLGISEGTRSGLWFEFARIIGELRPHIVLLENVTGILTRDGTIVITDLAQMGYVGHWGIISAADAGAPHQRERWFLVAHRNDRHGAEPAAIKNRVQNKVGNVSPQDARRAELVHAAGSGRKAVADAYRDHSQKQASTEKRASSRIPARYRSSRAYLVNTSSPRLQGRNAPARQRKLGFYSRRSEALRAYRLSQSRMGRGAHGLSAGLDRHRWPAPPGPQHAWEPPRVLPESAPQLRHRLQALGNAVVPQVIIPVAQAIGEWLDMQGQQGSIAA